MACYHLSIMALASSTCWTCSGKIGVVPAEKSETRVYWYGPLIRIADCSLFQSDAPDPSCKDG